MEWDEIIEDEEKMVWEKWRSSLADLENIEVSRCIKTSNFGEVTSITLRHFRMPVRMNMVNVAMHDWLAKPERFIVY